MEQFTWNPVGKGRLVFLTAFTVLCLVAWWLLPGDTERRLALCGLMLPSLGMVVAVTTVDPARRSLVRRWRWFGCIPIVRREQPLDDFQAVTLRGIQDPQPGDPVYLMLARKDGRFMKISYFHSSALHDGSARETAERLSRATGLPVADAPASGYTRPVSAWG